MIDSARCVAKARANICVSEEREVSEDFALARAAREHVEDIGDAQPRTCDDRSTAADLRIDDDATGAAHANNLPQPSIDDKGAA